VAGVIIVAAAIAAALLWRARDRDKGATRTASPEGRSGSVSFGPKCAWLAVRGTSPERVMKELGLAGAERAPWPEGVALACAGATFVGGPVGGWTLAVGLDLAEALDPENASDSLVVRLSKQLDTEVQFFGTHRVTEWHAWAKAIEGRLKRAYVYEGESGSFELNHGAQSEEERRLGFNFFDDQAPEAQDDSYWEREDLRWPDEDDVLALAAEWSVDPANLDERSDVPAMGWLGTLEPSWLPPTP
jgi:hypothetical protein